jgi:hydrogenase nickel incorporation protein HypA/HybF
MHELAITENILDIALKHANAQRITDVHIAIGELSTFVDGSVRHYWDIISKGTPAEGSQLHFRHIPILLQCRDCNAQFNATKDMSTCTSCGSQRLKVLAGDEFSLESIEVKT